MEVGKLSHLKSHDCHVFMETLVPIAFCGLPERIWKPITEISLFFKDLCSSTLREENLHRMDKSSPSNPPCTRGMTWRACSMQMDVSL